MTRSDQLLAIAVDGTATDIDNTYEAIRKAIDGTMDFHQVGQGVGVYLDDEGKLKRLPLNVPVSLFAGEGIYGPCVVACGNPDGMGETVAADPRAIAWFKFVCERWNMVVVNIMVTGCGDPFTRANPDDMMGPMIFTDEDMPPGLFRAFFGDDDDVTP